MKVGDQPADCTVTAYGPMPGVEVQVTLQVVAFMQRAAPTGMAVWANAEGTGPCSAKTMAALILMIARVILVIARLLPLAS